MTEAQEKVTDEVVSVIMDELINDTIQRPLCNAWGVMKHRFKGSQVP